MSFDKFLDRFIELIQEDSDLRDAIIDLIDARAEAERELAAWRRRRK